MDKEFSSFRDDNGFVYYEKDRIYRLFKNSISTDFKKFTESQLPKILLSKNYIIPYNVSENNELQIIVEIEKVPFITYPNEWSFSMLNDAAKLTLEILLISKKHNFTLKDASAYNIQFVNGKPVFIDLGSFKYQENNNIWEGYYQFCKHFLAPLALMAKTDISLSSLMRNHIDGIPLSLAVKLLPFKSYFNISILIHLVAHQYFQKKYSSKIVKEKSVDKTKILSLINNLLDFLNNLKLKNFNTEWNRYYEKDVDSDYLLEKKQIVERYLQAIGAQIGIWDIGANNGMFCEIALKYTSNLVASDIDPIAVESLYLSLKTKSKCSVLPLVVDITNVGGGFGWNNLERKSIFDRIKVETILALAIVHHLRISYGITLELIASFFAQNCKNLIIEFVPKSDDKVKLLLANREDVFLDYEIENFILCFSKHFNLISKSDEIANSKRIILNFKNKL